MIRISAATRSGSGTLLADQSCAKGVIFARQRHDEGAAAGNGRAALIFKFHAEFTDDVLQARKPARDVHKVVDIFVPKLA